LASAKAADDRRRGTLAATTLSEPATAADNRRCALANDRPLQPVCRRARPRRRTGRRNCPRAPSPIDEALPSPQPTGGGTSPSASTVPTLLARSSAEANSPSRSETPSLLLPTTASSSPSSQPFDVKMAVSMLSDGGNAGNAHPFRACGPPTPQRMRTRRNLRPGRVGRRHGPRAPNLLEPLLCGRRHRPRAPNEWGGWA
jgi:hypothetical protein